MNIIITGASRGIGKAIAEKFAAEKNSIFLCSKNIETLNETAEEIKSKYPLVQIFTFAANLAVQADADSFAQFCLQNGTPHILINNAGSFAPGNLLDEADGNLDTMMQNNLYSTYYLTRKIAPIMVENKSGHIFNISSIAALKAYDGGGSYSISKFALNGFSKNLRYELQDKGVKVTTVFPGAVFTDSWEGFDNSTNRIMEANDIAQMIYACTQLSPSAVPEEIVIRPQLGDL
jgi:short-subunit dehydrogenase